MQQFTYRKLDAFAAGKSGGNPAACLYLSAGTDLSGIQMQAIAREHRGFVSEVIYCWPISDDLYRLRYYSSECEVEFCGHGTIACIYNLINSSYELKRAKEITIRTNKGDLKVYNELETLDAVFITAPEPQFLPVAVNVAGITEKLGITPETIHKSHPVELIDAGLRTLIVPVDTLKNTITMNPDEQELKAFCLDNGIDIILVFSMQVTGTGNRARTRVFAPKFGYLEDPATGSGNSAFGYYMLKHGLWDGEPVSIEQNNETDNYNIVKLKTAGEKVLFGGNAVTKIAGHYFVQTE